MKRKKVRTVDGQMTLPIEQKYLSRGWWAEKPERGEMSMKLPGLSAYIALDEYGQCTISARGIKGDAWYTLRCKAFPPMQGEIVYALSQVGLGHLGLP